MNSFIDGVLLLFAATLFNPITLMVSALLIWISITEFRSCTHSPKLWIICLLPLGWIGGIFWASWLHFEPGKSVPDWAEAGLFGFLILSVLLTMVFLYVFHGARYFVLAFAGINLYLTIFVVVFGGMWMTATGP
ncbi:MAG: hypothetical protein ACM33T_06815 [Solirubrobacterales bacterium]